LSGSAVLVVTLEMTEDEVAVSVISALVGISNTVFSSNLNSDKELSIRAISGALTAANEAGFKFDTWSNSCDKFGLAISAIRRHVHSKPDCKLVMIDYLGLLRSPGHASKTYEIGYMMQTIKQLAMELNIVILVLAQTNRQSTQGKLQPEYTLDSLAHSAALGDTANVVMFIDSKEGSDTAQIIVKKHRGGRLGSVVLRYHKSKNLFLDMVEANYDN
jgi:replicative DNA helicase